MKDVTASPKIKKQTDYMNNAPTAESQASEIAKYNQESSEC
jgi:hypothetical protein